MTQTTAAAFKSVINTQLCRFRDQSRQTNRLTLMEDVNSNKSSKLNNMQEVCFWDERMKKSLLNDHPAPFGGVSMLIKG